MSDFTGSVQISRQRFFISIVNLLLFFIHKYPYALEFLLCNFLITVVIIAYACRCATPVKTQVRKRQRHNLNSKYGGLPSLKSEIYPTNLFYVKTKNLVVKGKMVYYNKKAIP